MNFQEHEVDVDKFEEDLVTNFSECSFKCVQRCFVFVHVILAFTAILIFTTGILLLQNTDEVVLDYIQESDLKGFFNAAVFLTTLGAVTFMLPFLACIATRKYSFRLLLCYLIILLLVMGVEITCVVIAWIYRTQITDIDDLFMKSMHRYGQKGFEKHTTTLNSIQRQHMCCGSTKHEEWFLTKWGKFNNGSLPESCCPQQSDMKICDVNELLLIEVEKRVGCYIHIEKFVHENLHLISGFSIWIITLDALGICFLVIFLIQIRRKETKYEPDDRVEMYRMKDL